MTKRKNTKRKRKPNNKSNFITKILLLLLITLLSTIVAYFILLKEHNQKENSIKKEIIKNDNKNNDNFFNEIEKKQDIKEPIIDKYEEYTQELEKEYIDTNKDKEEEKEAPTKVIEEEKKIIEKTTFDKKPKLAIVIDDVTLQSQINNINKIGYTVNIALMPPTKQHKNSAKIAQNLPFAIVHLPLQAGTTKFEEENTLKVGDSYSKIEKRIAQIRKQYPNVKYTNNHTGSKFTADEKSMDLLIKALKKYDFQFIDSRTTQHSVVKKFTSKYDMPYIARNIFLDNQKDFKYIQNQLIKAINIAKKTGSSIAIGHPYPITMKVLKDSAYLLEDLDLVYVNQLPIN